MDFMTEKTKIRNYAEKSAFLRILKVPKVPSYFPGVFTLYLYVLVCNHTDVSKCYGVMVRIVDCYARGPGSILPIAGNIFINVAKNRTEKGPKNFPNDRRPTETSLK